MIKKALLVSCITENKYEIPIGKFIMGRYNPEVREIKLDIEIKEPRDNCVSRTHCRIYNDGEKVQVEDFGSTNGTYVNNKKR